ncbi:hypothetical protein OUZ56_032577 [Daphnia magna]|uniref:Uncharacterized protein n=1 Tax=Daphnia magna TaxID=35525 RepID=A0ABR0B9B1_9CRUS|nr:hypothetical protein OUZ56_032577 [Daphnia magna]
MIEPFAKHSSLNNDVKLVIIQLREYGVIRSTRLARVNVICAKPLRSERLCNLNAVRLIQRRGNDLEPFLAVDDGTQCFVRHDDALAKCRIVFAELTDLVSVDKSFFTARRIDVPERRWPEHLCPQSFDIS